MAPTPLDYVAVPESFKLPAHANFGGTSGGRVQLQGNIFVIHRGPMPLMEFDPDGHFIRGFGDGLFERPHGLRIDADEQHLGDRRRQPTWSTGSIHPAGWRWCSGCKNRPANGTNTVICGCSTSRTRR